MSFYHINALSMHKRRFRSCFVRRVSSKPAIVKSVKIATVVVATIMVFSGFGCAVNDTPEMQYDYQSGQCVAAGSGDLSLEVIDNLSAADRSFLLSCALSVVIGEADRTREEHDRLISKKRKLSDAILSKGIDIGFVGRNGNHLLNDVVLSFLPEQWKLHTLKKMIDMGADVNHRNKYGKNAVDLAKFSGQENITKLLTSIR